MLVLTRKTSEKILIGDNIVITVVAARNNNVKIGIDAPRYINIAREELLPLTAETTEPECVPASL